MINYTVIQESIEDANPLIIEMALGYENYINKLWKSNQLTFVHNDKHYYVFAYDVNYVNNKLIVRLTEK